MYNKYQIDDKVYIKKSNIRYIIEFFMYSEEQQKFLYSLKLDNNEKKYHIY